MPMWPLPLRMWRPLNLPLVEADCPVQTSASGRPALFTQDPDGNIIELTQIV